MGAVATSSDSLHEKLEFMQYGATVASNVFLKHDICYYFHFPLVASGGVPSPFDCYLVNRGLKTLHLRMRQHQANGLAVAKHLEQHDMIERVLHPGLASHPQHELAKRQMRGFSGMVTCYIKGGLNESRAFLKTLKVFTLAESLGGFESLAEHP